MKNGTRTHFLEYGCRQQPSRWPPMIPISWYLCSVYFSTFECSWFIDLLLMNRIRQQWWFVTSEIRLQNDCASVWVPSIALSLTLRESSCHVVRRPYGKELMFSAKSHRGPEAANSHMNEFGRILSPVSLWNECSPGVQVLRDAKPEPLS